MQLTKTVSRWRMTHRWLAWSLGFIFILQGLSGSFLVIAEQVDGFFNPEMTAMSGTEGAFLHAMDVLEQTHPRGVGMGVSRIDDAGKFMTAFWATPDPLVPSEYKFWLGRLHPTTGEVISAHDYGDFPNNKLQIWAFVHAIHTNLTLGAVGKFFQIGVALFLLMLLASGVVNLINRRSILKDKPTHLIRNRVSGSWHRKLGLGFSGILALLLISGIAWQLETVLDNTFTLQSKSAGQTQMSLRNAWEVSQKLYPGSQTELVMTPYYLGGTFRLKVIPKIGEQAGIEQELFLDAHTGELIKVRNDDSLDRFEELLSLIEPIHGGIILGVFGKFIAFFAGLVPLAMMVLGYLNRRRV